MQTITIPTPCHEDWNKMTAKEQGRHCNVCSKTVVDFTAWQPQEILLHFKANKNVCGRFTTDQLNEPIPTQEDFAKQIAYFNISTVKKMAAIFLFVVMVGGSSCNENTLQGDVITKDYSSKKTPVQHLQGDTATPDYLVGEAKPLDIIIKDSTEKANRNNIDKKLNTGTQTENVPVLMGAPEVIDTKNRKKPACIKTNNNIIGEPANIENQIKIDTVKEFVIGKMKAKPISK
jgi:hypothetical protein